MTTEQQKEEILDRIRQLPPSDAVAIAVRMAMRVLPVLGNLWPKPWVGGKLRGNNGISKNAAITSAQMAQWVFAIFRVCQCAHGSVIFMDNYDATLAVTESIRALRMTREAACNEATGAAYAAADAASNTDIITLNISDPYFDGTANAYISRGFYYYIAKNSARARRNANNAVKAANRVASRSSKIAARIINATVIMDAVILAESDATSSILAAYSAANAAGVGKKILEQAVTKDLDYIMQRQNIANKPLWAADIPKEIRVFWQILQAGLLRLDNGFQYWIDWYEARLQGEELDWEKIKNQVRLTQEMLALEPKDINAYLLKLAKRQADRPLNRVRVILLGPGAAGKTSLLRVLHGKPVLEGQEDKTVGIEIREAVWDARQNYYARAVENSTDTVVHFWDFGGQVMYHATHQFFLRSNCVYLIVLDGRRAAAGGSEADYWLEHVRAFAPEAPVLLVGNKADQGSMDWEQNRLRNKYPNIRPGGFYQLACTDPTNPRYDLARLQADLHDALEQVGMVQQKFTEEEFAVLEEIRRRSPSETFLSKSDYQALCTKHGLSVSDEQNSQSWLLDLMDKLGVVIYFPNIHDLDDLLLNPRWLTYGVYQVLEQQKSHVTKGQVYGWLAAAEVHDNLGNRLDYPKERCSFLLEAMESFQVAYRLMSGIYAIPSLLPPDEPAGLDFPEGQARAFRFRFDGLLPPQLLPRLIVARHADIDEEKVWRHGALLHNFIHGNTHALLRGDAYDRTLTMWLVGEGVDQYFSVLYQHAHDILSEMPELPYEELIRLPAAARLEGQGFDIHEGEPWARWDNVLCAWRDGETLYREKGIRYQLKIVLNIITEAVHQDWASKKSNIFFIDNKGGNMGDSIHISGGQVGAAGSHSKAENNTFQQVQQGMGAADLAVLAEELTRLLPAMKNAAAAPEHYEALAAVARAQDAAGKQDAPAALQHLQSAGRWALSIATEIGVSLAAEYLKQGL